LKIQSEIGKQYDVVLIGEVLPTDPKNIKYTSQWAVRSFEFPSVISSRWSVGLEELAKKEKAD
jgi:hypothetical protein